MTEKIEEQELIDFISSLQNMDGLSPEDLTEMRNYLLGATPEGIPENLLKEEDAKLVEDDTVEEHDQKRQDIRNIISTLNIPGKIKLALFGNATCRGLLIKDGNKVIQLAVLKNPKLQEKEIEMFSRNPNISAVVLRLISENRQWIKPYGMKINLVSNPKTPTDVSMRWLRYLHMVDLKKISRSKNVPSAVTNQAKKFVEMAEKKS